MKDIISNIINLKYYCDKWNEIKINTNYKDKINIKENGMDFKLWWVENNFDSKTYEINCCVSGVKAFFIEFELDCKYECLYKPHLAPKENMIIGDKAFRSPVIILDNKENNLIFIPDLLTINKNRQTPHAMDYIKKDNKLVYGICNYIETGHVYYEVDPNISDELLVEQNIKLYFSINKTNGRDFRFAEEFLWKKYKNEFMDNINYKKKEVSELSVYPKYAYQFALENWKEVTWQQFKVNDIEVGGIAFLVTADQKPGCGQEQKWREKKSIWNQAWFSSLRSAYGFFKWGEILGKTDYLEKAKLVLEFTLQAPQINGLFPSYFEADDNNEWQNGKWCMSAPRRPADLEDYVHLLDCSWTSIWLLKWYRDINQDKRILDYVSRYINRLKSLINNDGSLPAWINPYTNVESDFLRDSPENALHISLFLLYFEITQNNKSEYIEICEKIGDFVTNAVVNKGRWEDFETYWSCSKEWEYKKYGVKDEKSGLYASCNFGMYWTCQAYLDLYKVTLEKKWLDLGEKVLSELSLYQQIWQPIFMKVNVIGGFGVMNTDDEWNDARQSLFSLTYLDYYKVTKNEKYILRANWAINASFYMMYCPENPKVKKLYEIVHKNFNEFDYGFHMENFNHHDGTVSKEGLGEFTIFDWGCGAASTSLLEFINELKK